MGRESLGPNEGTLFVFESSGVHCFWMRKTPLPLSIAFIDDDGRMVDIARMAPLSEKNHCPGTSVRYALEMEQGWFEKRGNPVGHRPEAGRTLRKQTLKRAAGSLQPNRPVDQVPRPRVTSP